MEDSFYNKDNHDINIMDLVNLGIVVLISLKNTIIFFLVFFLLIGFLSTSTIDPQYKSQSRLLIELPNINLKDEQNIDFSSFAINGAKYLIMSAVGIVLISKDFFIYSKLIS